MTLIEYIVELHVEIIQIQSIIRCNVDFGAWAWSQRNERKQALPYSAWSAVIRCANDLIGAGSGLPVIDARGWVGIANEIRVTPSCHTRESIVDFCLCRQIHRG